MLSDNLVRIRKERGLTQEALAVKLGVVRQTISKWEKGLAVPDAEMLSKIADVLEVSVVDLLGNKSFEKESSANDDRLADQLTQINEQIAVKNRRAHRIWKTVGIVIGVLAILNIVNILCNIVIM